MVEKQLKKANELIQSLKTTLKGSDIDKLISEIENIVDFIIEEEFEEIRNAYEVLKDVKNPKQY